MPTTNTEKNYVADVLKRELEPLIGRKLVTVASGAGVLKKGAVLGTVTASGKMNYYDPTTAPACSSPPRASSRSCSRTSTPRRPTSPTSGSLGRSAPSAPQP